MDRGSNCLPYEDDTTLTWTERLVDRLPFVREQDTGREIRTRVRDPEIGVGREDATLVSGFPNSGGMPVGRTSSHLPSSGRGAASVGVPRAVISPRGLPALPTSGPPGVHTAVGLPRRAPRVGVDPPPGEIRGKHQTKLFPRSPWG